MHKEYVVCLFLTVKYVKILKIHTVLTIYPTLDSYFGRMFDGFSSLQIQAILNRNVCTSTFSPHAIFEALLEAAVLALIAMVLVHRTVFTTPALVRQVPAH